jgi:hypothetical protein
MSKTGYVEIASRLVTVARSCFLNLGVQDLAARPVDGRPYCGLEGGGSLGKTLNLKLLYLIYSRYQISLLHNA